MKFVRQTLAVALGVALGLRISAEQMEWENRAHQWWWRRQNATAVAEQEVRDAEIQTATTEQATRIAAELAAGFADLEPDAKPRLQFEAIVSALEVDDEVAAEEAARELVMDANPGLPVAVAFGFAQQPLEAARHIVAMQRRAG